MILLFFMRIDFKNAIIRCTSYIMCHLFMPPNPALSTDMYF